jgi:hypothetical protein
MTGTRLILPKLARPLLTYRPFTPPRSLVLSSSQPS